jgi:uncharacterized protein (DUF2062 family)
MIKRVRDVIATQLKQGVHPHALALTCSLAITVGIFPLLGFTTLMIAVAGYFLRLNQPILHALHYLMTPFQLLMIPVFGFAATGFIDAKLDVTPQAIITRFMDGPAEFLGVYGLLGFYAVLIWAVFSVFAGYVIYRLSLNWFAKFPVRGGA